MRTLAIRDGRSHRVTAAPPYVARRSSNRLPRPQSHASRALALGTHSALVQRACACGGGASCECGTRSEKTEERTDVSSIVARATTGGGHELDGGTRTFMEGRFGRGLGHIRVHTGATAAESARAIDALAFTAGRDIVFGEGRYRPDTASGRHLIAHELAHSLQQGGGSDTSRPRRMAVSNPGHVGEREADAAAEAVIGERESPRFAFRPVDGHAVAQRQRDPNTIDAAATAIITYAQDTSVAIATRAPELVRRLCTAYYATDAALVSSVVYNATEAGLSTTYTGTGATLTGIISVGDYFINGTTRTGIARRVLQLGHELEHVRQQRSGLGGGTHRHEREFLAFHWEATTPEKAGTGRMPHATRVALIDAAIGNFNCLSATEKATYNPQYQQLLTLRTSEQTASGNPATPVPTACSG